MNTTTLTLHRDGWEMMKDMIEAGIKYMNDDFYEKKDYRLKMMTASLEEILIRIKTRLLKPGQKFTLTLSPVQGLALYNAYLEEYVVEYDLQSTAVLKTNVATCLDKAVA